MDYFGRALAMIAALGGLVAVFSRYAAWREERIRARTIEDVKYWMGSDDGKFFLKSYLEDLQYHVHNKKSSNR